MIKLSEIEACKDQKDRAKLAGYVDQLFDITHDMSMQILHRIFYRNLLYYIGEQYIEFVKSAGTFRRKLLPAYIPTPVCNQVKDFVRAIKSMFLNQKLIPKVSPNSLDPEDTRAAALGGKLLTWMDGINDGEFADEKEEMIIMLVLNGTSFLRTFPDMNIGKWFMTEGGPVKTGEVVTRSVLPFSVRVDRFGKRLRDKRWVGLQSLQSREWVEDTFKVKIEGSPAPDIIDYERKLMKLVSQVSPWKGAGLETQTFQEDDDVVLLRELEFQPTIKFPKGRYLLSCQKQILLDTPRLPIKSSADAWAYSLVDFHFDFVPGRFWSDAPVNDLISPQNAINEIDQLASLNRKGIGRPRVVTPGDIGLKRIGEGGHSFLMMKYDALLSGGREPKIEPGIPLSRDVFEERAIHQTTIQDVGGDPKNVLKGHAPSASSSGIQIDILRETAERGHYPDLDRYNRTMGKVYKHRLILASEVYTEKRQVKITGRGNRQDIFAFKGADLKNNTDVNMDLDSGISTTRAGQTQVLMQLTEKGFFGPIDQDPNVREELLTRLGLSGVTSQGNIDMELAEMENQSITSGRPENIMLVEQEKDPATGQPIGEPVVVSFDPTFRYHNHAIHFEIHRRAILSPSFLELPKEAQTILMAHADLHESLIKMAEAQALAAQAEEQPPGEGEEPGQKPKGPPRAPGKSGKAPASGPGATGSKVVPPAQSANLNPLQPGAGGRSVALTESRMARRPPIQGGPFNG